MVTGRIIEARRTNYAVNVEGKTWVATVRGNFHEGSTFPKVGDYVMLELLADDKAVIEKILERRSVIKRRGAEDDEVQVIAANVDLIFIVMGLDGDYNLSRLERYLLLAKQSGIPAVLILNKLDLLDDVTDQVAAAEAMASAVPVHAVSALTGVGMERVLDHIGAETTAVLLGSSGAGKSTVTNWLLDRDQQEIGDVRADDSRGRHTTTTRQLFTLPQGGYLIDTPGMRELGVLDSDVADEQAVFDRIEAFAEQCRFRNCDHEKSAGCAVIQAIKNGDITEREFKNYQKLLMERAYQEEKSMTNAQKFNDQLQKRRSQREEAIRRHRLSRR